MKVSETPRVFVVELTHEEANTLVVIAGYMEQVADALYMESRNDIYAVLSALNSGFESLGL